MPWAKFDDKTIRNRKVRRVARKSPPAALLWMFAIIYCCEQMTDGEIEGDELRELLPMHHEDYVRLLVAEQMIHDKPGCDSPGCLANNGLPVEGTDMYVIHDFADSQMTADQWLDLRANKAYAAHVRWHLTKPSDNCEHCKNGCTPDARCIAGACASARPPAMPT